LVAPEGRRSERRIDGKGRIKEGAKVMERV
jgi:hypothetical protein